MLISLTTFYSDLLAADVSKGPLLADGYVRQPTSSRTNGKEHNYAMNQNQARQLQITTLETT